MHEIFIVFSTDLLRSDLVSLERYRNVKTVYMILFTALYA